MNELSMAEMATAFCDRPARSAIRRVHVLLQGTHCIQQHFGDNVHIDIQFSIVGIINVIHLTSPPLGNTRDELEKVAKFLAAVISIKKKVARQLCKIMSALELLIVNFKTNCKIFDLLIYQTTV